MGSKIEGLIEKEKKKRKNIIIIKKNLEYFVEKWKGKEEEKKILKK